ncbi:thiol-disulfide oxidoreductase DCC family protein [Metabacillus herbersteinensis]|uniref:Thiol-disulfide oxidoreductase DCC family protein n=1 Tax=Metabacillus herbersteinensis TaxID=283816 RepID=A0ABV6GC68_9BACI
MKDEQHKVLLFDGVCNFCNNTINFVIRHDKKGRFRFAALQSEVGQDLLTKHQLPNTDFDSFVYLDHSTVYTKSTATLHVLKGIGGFWSLFYVLIVIPNPLRDQVYLWIAKNRYKWFGKRDQCMIPTPEVRKRFLS